MYAYLRGLSQRFPHLRTLKYLSHITFAELINALQAQEQRRAIRKEVTEGAFQAREKEKAQSGGKGRKQSGDGKRKKEAASSRDEGKKDKYPPCSRCKNCRKK